MAEIAEISESLFFSGVTICIHLLEIIGIYIIMSSSFKALRMFLKSKTSFFSAELAKGMSLALEFKLGGEILRTVIVRDLSEMALVGAIIVLRAVLAMLIHWEIAHSHDLQEDPLVREALQSKSSEEESHGTEPA